MPQSEAEEVTDERKKMKYILDAKIALRSWRLVPYAYYIRHDRNARGLCKEEFEFLSSCDGRTRIVPEENKKALAEKFLACGFIHPAQGGEVLSDWQKPRHCDNRYFPAMNWMITGKCNYNCLHCFNAADNAPLMSEWTLPEAEKLLDEAQICGINAFTITGGEPMLHQNFFEIIAGIYARGMYVEELNTNGHFIDQESLDRLKETGCRPLIKISFDGLGYHDWLRNRKGAEKDALRAMKLCVENGFPVKAQTNVHRRNLESMLLTATLLDEMGIDEMRVIRTTEVPRWSENAQGAALKLAEYYDGMLDFASRYTREKHRMAVDIWQFLTLFPQMHAYRIRPVEYSAGEYRDSLPVCRGNRGMTAVSANGNLYPCMQMSGTCEARGDVFGNVKTDGLQIFLQDGNYLDEVCRTVGELAGKNGKCGACEYFRQCAGGCRALAYAFTGDQLGVDPAKCLFFENGYHRKIESALAGWENLQKVT